MCHIRFDALCPFSVTACAGQCYIDSISCTPFRLVLFYLRVQLAERCLSLVPQCLPWCMIVTGSSLWTTAWFRSLCFHPLLTASKSFTKSSKSDRMILSTRGPQKETLEETKIYSIVIGPSVSQVAGASPFCRAVKVFLVQEWNKLGLLGILLPTLSASCLGRNTLPVAVTWRQACHSA